MGGGALWDIGCYPLSFTRTVLGTEPLEAFGWQVTSPSGIDEVFAGQLRFPGDIYFQLDCSFKIPAHVFMEIVGDEGTLNIPQPFNTARTQEPLPDPRWQDLHDCCQRPRSLPGRSGEFCGCHPARQAAGHHPGR